MTTGVTSVLKSSTHRSPRGGRCT